MSHAKIFHLGGAEEVVFSKKVFEQCGAVVEVRQEQLLDGVRRLRLRKDVEKEWFTDRLRGRLFGLK